MGRWNGKVLTPIELKAASSRSAARPTFISRSTVEEEEKNADFLKSENSKQK